ncbi:UNVERIFIED_CONTAM: hypothetical protein GTU68_002014 [Idotea baltica]|nr:hypothetical protein [Idotea baltica]
MQFPFNLQTALSLESIIKEEGALPATIGVINGKIHVGLSQDQIEFLSQCVTNCVKVSRRDLPYVLAQKYNGGTTVSGTMLIAHTVGIPLFVTGGIGGVHRGGQSTMDVSADLTELGRTPVTVVSAGVKSILDVGRTLEYLETQGSFRFCTGFRRVFLFINLILTLIIIARLVACPVRCVSRSCVAGSNPLRPDLFTDFYRSAVPLSWPT